MAVAITSFTPAAADGAGGTQITITGTQLDIVEAFLVGTKQAQIVSKTPTTAVIRVPAQAAGAVKIFAVDEDGGTLTPSATNLTITGATLSRGSLTGAAKWGVQVDASPALDGSNYLTLRALTNVQPVIDQTTQDTSHYEDYDPNTGISWGSDAPTQLKFSLQLSFDRFKYSGAYDPAQEIIRAAHDKGGDQAVVRVRWFDRTGGPESYEGFATVTWAEQGGDTAAKSMVQSTLKGQGQRSSVTNPSA